MATVKKTIDPTITLQLGKANCTEIVWAAPKTYTGRVADALIKLTDAGMFGVHKSEFRPDQFARLEQAGIAYRMYSKANCGTDGKSDWVRMAVEWRILPATEVAA